VNTAIKKLFLIISILGISGCASIITGDTQSLRLSVACKGKEIRTYCTVQNDTGRWTVLTPVDLEIGKSRQPLNISCRGLLGTTGWTLDSSPNTAMAANVVFGGVVGALVDHRTARGYQYPEMVELESPICKFIK
jgi:uncharacterized protein YceK